MSALTARKPMQRTGFNRRRKLALAAPIEREKRLSDAAKYAIENALKKPPNLAQVSLSTPAAPVEKESPCAAKPTAVLWPACRVSIAASGRTGAT